VQPAHGVDVLAENCKRSHGPNDTGTCVVPGESTALYWHGLHVLRRKGFSLEIMCGKGEIKVTVLDARCMSLADDHVHHSWLLSLVKASRARARASDKNTTMPWLRDRGIRQSSLITV